MSLQFTQQQSNTVVKNNETLSLNWTAIGGETSNYSFQPKINGVNYGSSVTNTTGIFSLSKVADSTDDNYWTCDVTNNGKTLTSRFADVDVFRITQQPNSEYNLKIGDPLTLTYKCDGFSNQDSYTRGLEYTSFTINEWEFVSGFNAISIIDNKLQLSTTGTTYYANKNLTIKNNGTINVRIKHISGQYFTTYILSDTYGNNRVWIGSRSNYNSGIDIYYQINGQPVITTNIDSTVVADGEYTDVFASLNNGSILFIIKIFESDGKTLKTTITKTITNCYDTSINMYPAISVINAVQQLEFIDVKVNKTSTNKVYRNGIEYNSTNINDGTTTITKTATADDDGVWYCDFYNNQYLTENNLITNSIPSTNGSLPTGWISKESTWYVDSFVIPTALQSTIGATKAYLPADNTVMPCSMSQTISNLNSGIYNLSFWHGTWTGAGTGDKGSVKANIKSINGTIRTIYVLQPYDPAIDGYDVIDSQRAWKKRTATIELYSNEVEIELLFVCDSVKNAVWFDYYVTNIQLTKRIIKITSNNTKVNVLRFTSEPTDKNIKFNDQLDLIWNVAGGDSTNQYTYQLKRDSINYGSPIVSSSSYTVSKSATTLDNGTYQLVVTNGSNTIYSNLITINVFGFITQPISKRLMINDLLDLQYSVTGGKPVSVNAFYNSASNNKQARVIGSGTTIQTSIKKFGNAAAKYLGVGQTEFDLGTLTAGDFSIECWIKDTPHTTGWMYYYELIWNPGNLQFFKGVNDIQIQGLTGYNFTQSEINLLLDGNWHHTSANYSNNYLSFYIDGQLIFNKYCNSSISTRNVYFNINNTTASITGHTGAYVDDLVFSLYKRRSGNFTPPTSQYVATTNDILVLNMNSYKEPSYNYNLKLNNTSILNGTSNNGIASYNKSLVNADFGDYILSISDSINTITSNNISIGEKLHFNSIQNNLTVVKNSNYSFNYEIDGGVTNKSNIQLTNGINHQLGTVYSFNNTIIRSSYDSSIIHISHDLGITWNFKKPCGDSLSNNVISFRYFNGILIASSHNSSVVYRSVDEGDTWSVITIPFGDWYFINHDGVKFTISAIGVNKSISSVDGLVWNDDSKYLSAGNGYSLGLKNIIPLQNNTAIISIDGGVTNSIVNTNIGGYVSAVILNDIMLVITTAGNTYAYSNNNGTSFITKTFPFNVTGHPQIPVCVWNNKIYVFPNANNNCYYSINGVDWIAQSIKPNITCISCFTTSNGTLIVAAEGTNNDFVLSETYSTKLIKESPETILLTKDSSDVYTYSDTADYNDSGNYHLQVSDGIETINSESFNLNVISDFRITQQPTNVTVYAGQSINIGCSVSGGEGDYVFKLKHNSIIISTDTITTNTKTFNKSANINDNGSYQYQIENNGNILYSNTITVTVINNIEFLNIISNKSLFENELLSFDINISSDDNINTINYKIYKDSTLIYSLDSTNKSITYSNTVSLSDTGIYHVEVTQGGSPIVTSNNFNVIIAKHLALNTTSSNILIIEDNNTSNLSISYLYGKTNNYRVTWYFNGNVLSDINTTLLNSTRSIENIITNSGNYKVVITNDIDVIEHMFTVIIKKPLVIINNSLDGWHLSGDNINLFVNVDFGISNQYTYKLLFNNNVIKSEILTTKNYSTIIKADELTNSGIYKFEVLNGSESVVTPDIKIDVIKPNFKIEYNHIDKRKD